MEHENTDIFTQTVTESDIDWLFCVELNCSERFQKWVASIIFRDIDTFKHIQCWRSVSNSAGESDLVWIIEHPINGRYIVLIENKINAASQPEQYNRYVERAEMYIEEGLAKDYSIALLSPESYRSIDSSLYHFYISYEQVIDWLDSDKDARSAYLKTIYCAAINKRNSPISIDESNLCFRDKIWQLGKSEFPSLNVSYPKDDSNNYWISMRHPNYTIIYKTYRKGWKFTNSVVDLELSGRGEDVEQLRREYASDLRNTGITVVKTGKSASFRLEVPMIEPPKYEENKVREALKAAMILKNFWSKQVS